AAPHNCASSPSTSWCPAMRSAPEIRARVRRACGRRSGSDRKNRMNPGAIVKPDLGNRRGAGVWAFLLALCTAGALAHVAVRMHGIQIAYALGRERRTNTQLEEQRRRLNIEIGMLKDPDRVIGIARAKLEMGPPAPENVVRLESAVLGQRPEP